MTTINQRIQEVIDVFYKGNTRAFAIDTKNNYHTIRNIIGERQSIPASTIVENIADSIESVNAAWLLTGQGEMLKSNEKAETPITSDNEVINLLKSQIEELKEEVRRLRTEKEKMHNELGYLKGLLENKAYKDDSNKHA